jgi:hypothetical protein
MDKVEKFDKETANAVGREIWDAVKPVAEKYGLKMRHVSGRYSDESLTEKYEFEVADADGIAFTKYAKSHGLNPEDLGKVVEENGVKFTVIGLYPSREARPIILRRESDGQRIVAAAEDVCDLLGGVSRFDAREQEGLSLKPGDRALTVDISPKYMNQLAVEVIAVNKKAKTATVKLGHKTFDKKVEKRVGDKPFTIALALLEKFEPVPLREFGTKSLAPVIVNPEKLKEAK